MFDELPRRILSAYHCVVSGYVKYGSVVDAADMVHGMIKECHKPDGFTYSID